MTYGVIVKMSAPVEMYDALHAELKRLTEAQVEGLLVHIGRRTESGFEVLEVWDSKEQYNHYNRTIVWPAAAKLAADQPAAPPPAVTEEEFEVRGLVLPQGGIYI